MTTSTDLSVGGGAPRPMDRLGLQEGTAAFIDGSYVIVQGDSTFEVEDPADRKVIGTLTEAGADLVDEAVRSAEACFTNVWNSFAPFERAQALWRLGAVLRDNADLLAQLESVDTGKPYSQAAADVSVAVRYCEYYASLADKIAGVTIPGDRDTFSFTVLEPYGVVGHVTPWNAPLNTFARGVAPSLAAGNTVVVKPSELTPYSTLLAARLFVEAGLPPGAVNIVLGRGSTTGADLVDHPGVRHVTFTGSVATGRAVGAAAARRIVGCNLELGGKSASLVFPDGDIESAAAAAAGAVVRNSGQSCFATTRQIVHASVHDEFVDRLRHAVEGLRLGRGLDDPDIGPLISAGQRDRVEELVSSALADGAELVSGGTRPDVGLEGYFFAPTVLAGVDNRFRAAREEIFGPVQSVLRFEEESEAITLANDSDYGLSAGVFTRDLSRAHRVARQLQAGQVQVNRYRACGVDIPFGGYKQSGLGREKGVEALRHYTQMKAVVMNV